MKINYSKIKKIIYIYFYNYGITLSSSYFCYINFWINDVIWSFFIVKFIESN